MNRDFTCPDIRKGDRDSNRGHNSTSKGGDGEKDKSDGIFC